MDTAKLYLGSCSWNYDSWLGSVYTEVKKHPDEYLPEYVKHFNTAGIDSWFYHIPTREEALKYKRAVAPGFKFTCKVTQSITLTHLRKKSPTGTLVPNPDFLSVELFNEYVKSIEPLREDIAAIMFEFEYLNREKMASLDLFIEKFSAFMEKTPKGLPYAIEIRNPNYLNDTYFDFLNKWNIIPVFAEKLYMPHIYEIYDRFGALIQGKVVLRLLGGDRLAIEKLTKEKWDTIVDPKKDDVIKIAAMIKKMLETLIVIVNVNNHYEGSAPQTIEIIKDLLRKEGIILTKPL